MGDRRDSFTVIGGGIVGMACAHALQTAGLSVEVIDYGEPAEKCSYGNAGSLSAGSVAPLAMPGLLKKIPAMLADPEGPLYIRPRYALKAAPWLLRFVRAARPGRIMSIARALSDLLGPAVERTLELARACDGDDLVRRTGQLQLYPSLPAFEADSAVWRLRRRMGVTVESVGRDEIRQLEPAVGPAYVCGVFLPDEGMVLNPWRLREAVASDFRRRGGRLVRALVEGFAIGPDGPTEVKVGGESRPVGNVVIAGGARSRCLASALGHPVPLETQRGYHVTLAGSGIELRRPVVAADRKCFATPLDEGLRLAGTVEFAGLEAPPDYRRARLLLEHGRRLFPELAVGEVSEWMGHRPCLPDSLPVIGRSPIHRNVFFAFGHGHLGLTGAAVTARHIADLAIGKTPTIDLRPFRIDRF